MATADAMARSAAAKKAAAAAKKRQEAAKKSTAKTSADRAATMKRTQTRAGKGVGNVAQRAKQNAGVKDGTIRLGANGKSYNVFDAKTQTWKRGIVTGTSKPKTDSKPAPKPSSSSSGGDFESWFKKTYPDTPYPGLPQEKQKLRETIKARSGGSQAAAV
jgi:hypothetical protein